MVPGINAIMGPTGGGKTTYATPFYKFSDYIV